MIAGVRITGVLETQYEIEHRGDTRNNRILIDDFIDSFFKDTNTPRTLASKSEPYVDIFSTDPKSFFYLLFIQESIDDAYSLINNRVDFNALDKKMEGDASWDIFVDLFPDVSSIKVSNPDQLKFFLEAFLTFDQSSGVLSLPLPLYEAIGQGEVYNVHPSSYSVDNRFANGLYLNKLLNT